MKLDGAMKIDKSCGLYSVGVPLINLWTQGKDFEDGLNMARDWLKTMYPDLKSNLTNLGKGKFILESNDPKMIGIVLKSARESAGLSLSEAAKILGYSSHNSIYAYEKSEREPSVSKFESMLKAYGINVKLAYNDIEKSA